MLIDENPFVSGTGNHPPHLAGRTGEKEVIEAAIARIMAKPVSGGRKDRIKVMLGRLIGKRVTEKVARQKRVSPPLVLLGPRGVGKTALLGWAQLRAEELGLRCAVLSGDLLGGPEERLGRAVMGQREYDKAAKKITTSLSLGHAAITGVDVKGQATHPAAVMGLDSIIDMQLRKGPLLIILDEAHAVAPGLLKDFCVAVQAFIVGSRPLALLMAGTPGLRGYLRRSEATFMERSKFMNLSLLALDETREALSKPAADTGVPMDEDALEMLAEWTDCYPYFIQLAGETVWEMAKRRGSSRITLEDAKHGLDVAGELRQDFYEERYTELVEGTLEKYARQMMDLIEKQPGRHIDYKRSIVGIQEANEGMDFDRALEIQRSLMTLGFIHKKKERVEAGIPSLFDYFKERVGV